MSTRREHGQATVETALVLPVLVLVTAALLELGLVGVDRVRLWHAAREAARVAAVDPDPRAAAAAARRAGLVGIEVSIDPPPAARRMGEAVTARVSYRPRGRLPLVGRLVSSLRLRAAVSMRIEQP